MEHIIPSAPGDGVQQARHGATALLTLNGCSAPLRAATPPCPAGRAGARNSIEVAILVASAWIERARQRRRLAELCDRSLKDIGVSRCDALQEASKPFWRE